MENEKIEKKRGGKNNIILFIIAVIIMIGIGGWYWYYSVESQYFSTDNAKVNANLYTITSPVPGKLVKLTVDQGSSVKANEIIGRVEGGSYIKSPVDGEVTKCDVKVDQEVMPTTVIAVIADTADVKIESNIEETDIGKIKEGQEVMVTIDAYPGKKFKAHVESIDRMTQKALSGGASSFSTSGTYTKVTQLIPVEIKVDDNVDLKSVIGTNAFVKIKIK